MVRRGLLAVVSVLLACGSEGGGSGGPAPGANNGTPPTSTPTGSPTTPPPPGDLPADPIVGLWSVKGNDARGDYEGEVEVRPEGAGYRFIRAVRWPGVTVENNRELHWLITGTLQKNGAAIGLDATLKRVDFITKRGALQRAATDGPIAAKGTLTHGQDTVEGTITGDGITENDKWSARKALPATPIFVDERKLVPAHVAPSSAEKSANFNLYSSFHDLDVVKPYVNRPEFQAAVHGHYLDTTDLAFYRANKNALRVVNKPIDAISLAETMVRADSYRWTLAEKADKYQADMHTRFIDPQVGMTPHGGPVGASSPSQMWESGDAALWTATYLASQVYRHQVTGAADAISNVELTLDALLKLQEITGDWGQFARALRKPRGAGGGWHSGNGPHANLEWLEGGNNDMIKGLFYGYLLGWITFCEGGKTGHASLCSRIATNVKHLADDVDLGGSNALASQQTNKLLATWMYSMITDDSTESLTYRAQAETYWSVVKVGVAATPVYYTQGIVDWSGTHLTFVGDVIGVLMSERVNVGGDAASVYRAHIDASHKNLEKQRFPTWHFIKAAYGTGASTSSPFIKDGVARLLETQYPKVGYESDRRLDAEFCMSPYPVVPWKGDWMKYPEEDRTQGLNSYPLFETGPSVNWWMTGNDYRSGEWEGLGNDYLHLYWFARKHGLIAATD